MAAAASLATPAAFSSSLSRRYHHHQQASASTATFNVSNSTKQRSLILSQRLHLERLRLGFNQSGVFYEKNSVTTATHINGEEIKVSMKNNSTKSTKVSMKNNLN
ncbi:hypothetical protein L1987_59415 [Smallanthus sonchifolius]|uniref:Uncharacterized protein n=1 Tax=Smallanthus sonchifolius TaxID=185202 RepID=A0ACB9D5I0_9ASTR|nr:hypothetical protein L1987_59415 [Smallanthus sonchifolius]